MALALTLALAPLPARAEEPAPGPVTVKVKDSGKAESQAKAKDKASGQSKKSKKSKKKTKKSQSESKSEATSKTKAKAGTKEDDSDQTGSSAKKHAKSKKGKSHKSKGHAAESAESAAPAPCYNLRSGGRTKSGKHGRCEPQSLTYARCRTKVDSCRTHHENGPLTWYQCETRRSNTSATPGDGFVLILGKNRHGMPTGHVMVVEKAEQKGTGTWRLVLSHTNYDRRCHLERDIEATYHQGAKTLDIHTGAWKAWGKGLPVAGFIVE
jgi:hypothetical protein